MRHFQNIFRIALLIAFPALIQAGNAPITTIATKTACPGQTVYLPVTVVGFTNIATFDLRIEFDSTVISFLMVDSINASIPEMLYGSGIVTGTTKFISVTWVTNLNPNPPNNPIPVTLASGSKLFTLKFNYIGGNTSLTFNNIANGGDACQYSDQNLVTLIDTPTATYYHDGQVSTGMVGGSVSGGSTIYYNTSTGNLTLSGHLGSVLKWQKQYNGEGYTDIPSTAGLTVYSEIPSYTGTWDYRAIVQNSPCSAVNSTATTVTVLTPIGTSKTWTGNTDTSWKTPTNWNVPGTPVAADDVIIPEGTARMPVVITTAACNNLLLKKNAALTVNPAKNLNVGGTMTIEGP